MKEALPATGLDLIKEPSQTKPIMKMKIRMKEERVEHA
jgi:hypothetical protein